MTEEWFVLLWWLYCLPLLFKVLQRSGSRCCYIVYYYCFRFKKGAVHVVVILSTITVLGLTKERFMLLLLYCLPFLFEVLRRSGTCCGCYIFYHYNLMAWQRSGSCCCCFIVCHYCLRFYRGMVCNVVVVILSTITV